MMATRTRTNIRLVEAVDYYLARLANEGKSEHTIKSVKYALLRFRDGVTGRDKNPYLHTIDTPDLDRYFYGPKSLRSNMGAASFNNNRTTLKVFFDYAVMMRWVDVNPVEAIDKARPDAPKSRLLLNAGELLALLEHAGNPVERIACALGMNTGLRANDIRHLTVFDASLASGTIQTEIRKTNKYDVKPITMELHRELVRWLDTYATLMGLEDRGQLENEW